jgi:hypothetical protein
VFVAFHEVLIGENKKIADYTAVRNSLKDLNVRVATSRGSTSVEERRQNINQIKGLISPDVVAGGHKDIYGDHTSFDIDEAVRRSEIEAAHYELEQGVLFLNGTNTIDQDILPKIVNTICAIANNGRHHAGTVFLGVADKDADAQRIKRIHGVEPRSVGRRQVVGVQGAKQRRWENQPSKLEPAKPEF